MINGVSDFKLTGGLSSSVDPALLTDHLVLTASLLTLLRSQSTVQSSVYNVQCIVLVSTVQCGLCLAFSTFCQDGYRAQGRLVRTVQGGQY